MKVVLKSTKTVAMRTYFEGNHEMLIDFSPTTGGKNEGPRPMDMVIAACGACYSQGVRTQLQAAGYEWDVFDLYCKGTRHTELDTLEELSLHFVIEGDIPHEHLRQILAKEAAQCPVIQSLKGVVTYAYTLNDHLVYPREGSPEMLNCAEDLKAGIFQVTENENEV